MNKIVLIEDDSQLRELISQMLIKYGFNVAEVKDFKNAKEEALAENPDVILLDINLPFFDGFEICKAIRLKSNVPIIIISARNSEVEQVMGMEFGADDYVTKPFSMEVLRAKITACIRRAYGNLSTDKSALTLGRFALDINTFKASFQGSVDLTKNEFRILKYLVERANVVVEREDLLRELWDDADFVDNNTLNVNISRIKAKLNDIGIQDVVHAKRGYGYILVPNWMDEHE